jgi:putative NADPH-quinone reductase
MIRVLGIAGSPRRGGNSETLLDRFLAGAGAAGGQVEKMVAARLDVADCVDCAKCWQDGRCVADDDYQQVCEKMIAADVVAIASPVYFWNVPAQLKSVIDRGQCMWVRKYKTDETLPPSSAGHERRRGVFLCVGGNEREYFEGIVQTIKGALEVYNVEYWAELLFGQVDSDGEIHDEFLALQEAYDLGFRAVTEAWN